MDAKATTTRRIGLPGAGSTRFYETVKRPKAHQRLDLNVTIGGDIDNPPAGFSSRLVTLTIQTPEGHSAVLLSPADALTIGAALVAYADRAGAR
jgi:hypothetical protein